MAVRIRLRRMGAKKRPFYRLVVADSRAARDGRVIDWLGEYDPVAEPTHVRVDAEKAKEWLARRGNLPTRQGVFSGSRRARRRLRRACRRVNEGGGRMYTKEMVEYLAKALVDHPDEVNVTQVEGDKSIILELRVEPSDMGKVIGRRGRVAQAIRTIAKAAAVRDKKMVHVEIVD